MDQDRFDQLARAFGSGRSRRSLLKGLGAAALGAVGLSRLDQAEAAKGGNGKGGGGGNQSGGCPTGATRCHGSCRDLSSDPTNCGGCGNVCGGGDACTTVICSAGQCVPAPVVCAGGDQCNVASCDPVNGCVLEPLTGASCNDGDACTQTDSCQNGVCVGGNPVVCESLDQCHVAGTCDPTSGQCSNPDAPDGIACNDDNACTSGEFCHAGTCVGGVTVFCTASGPCVTASCDPVQGCVETPKAAGAACDDATNCNGHETCDGAGHCVPGTPVSCGPCLICDPTQGGSCQPDPAQIGQPCPGDGNMCHGDFQCTDAGTCVPTAVVTCTASDQCHDIGTCDPTTGQCSNPNQPNGVRCNDGNGCTQADSCQNGVCVGVSPVYCQALDQCHVAGVCDPATGQCSNPPVADGTLCDSGAGANTGTCQGGACVASICKELLEHCVSASQCCQDAPTDCADNFCSGVVCCRQFGEPCNYGCDCCDHLVCNQSSRTCY